MLRKIWRLIEILLMLLGLAAIPVIALQVQDHGMRRTAEPPWSVQTLDDFRKWRPQYENAFRTEARGSVYYLVHGERARALASGRSGYVFDGRGNFVGWIRDTGDDTFLRIVMDETARKPLPVSAISIPAAN
jgi:hypothetical protein